MGRPRKGPWLRESDQCYYTTVGKRLVKLGEATDPPEEIQKRYEAIVASLVQPDEWTVVGLIDQFLGHCKAHNSASTYKFYDEQLAVFREHIGPRQPAASLTQDRVLDWVRKRYKGCAASTRHNAVRCVCRVYSWATKTGKLDRNPLVGIEKPTPTARELVIGFDDFMALVAHVKDQQFQDYLWFNWFTGARPQETRVIQAKHVDTDCKTITLDRLLSKGRKHRRRIWLCDDAAKIIARLIKKHPTGTLFRNKRDEPWNKNQLGCRFARLRAKSGYLEVCSYTLRHSYANRMLLSGVDALRVATLLGHRDTSMLARTYSHIGRDDNYMGTLANQGQNI